MHFFHALNWTEIPILTELWYFDSASLGGTRNQQPFGCRFYWTSERSPVLTAEGQASVVLNDASARSGLSGTSSRSSGATHLGPAHPTRWRLLNTRPNILYRLAKALTGESYSLVRNNPNSNVKKPKDISIRYFHNHVIDLGDGVTSNNITQGVAKLEAQSHASNSAPPAEIEAGALGKPSTV